MRNQWAGKENIPKTGGIILAPNHLSYADWGTIALFSDSYAHRYPVFMIKSPVFGVKFIGALLTKVGQLPVYRGRGDAGLVLKQAEKALATGACVIVYPEGTASRDPDLWPMVGKTGAARLALTTGAPVIPIAHWGAQEILPYGTKKPHLFPRKTVRMAAGPPVDLSAYAGQRLGASTLRAATADIMADITALLAKIRQETPPAAPWDLEAGGRVALDRTGGGSAAASPGGRSGGGGLAGRSRLRRLMKAAVLGAGSWGTTFAQVLVRRGTDTVLYARRPQLAKAIAGLHENPDYLPGVALTPALDATSDPAEALDGADLVAFAVPAQSLRSNLLEWAPLLPRGALLVSLMKGIELGSRLRMSEVIAEVRPELAGPAAERIAVVAGPNLAGEIVRRESPRPWWRACSDEGAAGPAGRVPHAVLPALHEHRRDRLRAGRRGEERDRDRGRHRGGDGPRRQHPGHADHPGAGRDRQAGFGAGRADPDVRRAGRDGRPGGHVQLAAVQEPHLRRVPGAGHDGGGGVGRDEPDRGGGGVQRPGARAGPGAPGGDADHRGRRGRDEDGLPVTQAASMLASRSAKPEWYGLLNFQIGGFTSWT